MKRNNQVIIINVCIISFPERDYHLVPCLIMEDVLQHRIIFISLYINFMVSY